MAARSASKEELRHENYASSLEAFWSDIYICSVTRRLRVEHA